MAKAWNPFLGQIPIVQSIRKVVTKESCGEPAQYDYRMAFAEVCRNVIGAIDQRTRNWSTTRELTFSENKKAYRDKDRFDSEMGSAAYHVFQRLFPYNLVFGEEFTFIRFKIFSFFCTKKNITIYLHPLKQNVLLNMRE
jgi:hypothetical protein